MTSHALIKKMVARVYDFYQAEIDQWGLNMWAEALEKESVEHIDKALKHYMKSGGFAPKPSQIIPLITELKDNQRRRVVIPRQEPVAMSNDELMDLCERIMDAETFGFYRKMVLDILSMQPEAELATLQWILMYRASLMSKGSGITEWEKEKRTYYDRKAKNKKPVNVQVNVL